MKNVELSMNWLQKVNVMGKKGRGIVPNEKKLNRHNNQMQCINLNWILVKKKKKERKTFLG